MSKGHGKWERAILAALKEAPAYYLSDLLPVPHTRSQSVALNRAANNLADAGKVNIAPWLAWCDGAPDTPEAIDGRRSLKTIFRIGCPEPNRRQITRLKRCQCAQAGTSATLKKPRCKPGPVTSPACGARPSR